MSRRKPGRRAWAERVVLGSGEVVYRARWLDENGRRLSRGSYDSMSAAEKVAAHFAAVAAERGDPDLLTPRRLVDRFLSSGKADPKLVAAVDGDEWALGLIRAFAPRTEVGALTLGDIERFVESLRKDHDGFIPLSSCLLAADLFQSAFRYAASEGLIGPRRRARDLGLEVVDGGKDE